MAIHLLPEVEYVVLFQRRWGIDMKKLVLLISITIFGWVGWWLGYHIGIMTAYLMSVAGSLIGVYFGVRINQNHLN